MTSTSAGKTSNLFLMPSSSQCSCLEDNNTNLKENVLSSSSIEQFPGEGIVLGSSQKRRRIKPPIVLDKSQCDKSNLTGTNHDRMYVRSIWCKGEKRTGDNDEDLLLSQYL